MDGVKVYRCRAHALRVVNIHDQIFCSRFRGKSKNVTNKEFRNKIEVVRQAEYFDTDPLYETMNERRGKL